jgi:hypothetical protein
MQEAEHESASHGWVPSRISDVRDLCSSGTRYIEAELPSSTCCHAFRATGLTACLENAQAIDPNDETL